MQTLDPIIGEVRSKFLARATKPAHYIKMIGVKSLTARQRLILRQLANFTCQSCKKPEAEVGTVEAHRTLRGNHGGTYLPSNIQMICGRCHGQRHEKEPGTK